MKKITLLILFIAISLTGFSQTTIVEYTFDADLEGWAAGSGATVTYDAATNYFTTAGSLSLTGLVNKVGKSANIDLSSYGAGDYTLTYKVKGDGSDPQKLRTQYKYGATAVQLSDDSVIGTETGGDGASTWQSYSNTFTLDGSETTLQIQLKIKTDATVYYFDDIKLIQEPCAGFAVAAEVVGAGTNVITTPLPCYPNGTDVEFTATPLTHWVFDNFSGDLSGSTNPQTLTTSGNADATVTANFSVEPGFMYDFTFDTDGELEGWSMDSQVSVVSHTAGLVTLSITADQWSRFNLFDFPIPATIVDPARYNKVTIVLKNEEPTTDQLAVTIGPNNNTNTYPLASDANFQTFEVDLTQFVDWTGDIDSFRIRFADEDNPNGSKPSVTHDVVIDSVVFSFQAGLSVEDYRDDASITLYPNPVSDVFRIDSPLAIEKVEVFNLLGQKAMTVNSNTVDASGLAKGMYIIKVTQENDVISTKRFIKQ